MINLGLGYTNSLINRNIPLSAIPAAVSSLSLINGVSDGATISRASTATVTDFEGLVKDVQQNEARFTGARRVENLLTDTATLATQDVTTIAGDYTLSFSGTGSITLSGTSTESLSGTGASVRVAKTVTTTAGTLTLTVSGSVTNAQLELVEGQANQNPSEYVSNGVISGSTVYHGAGVDGVKYFAYENGNTVASDIVTEATGAAISSSILKGYLAEPQRTNYYVRSEELDDATWIKTNVTVSSDVTTSPRGLQNADKVIGNTGTAQHFIGQGSSSYTASVAYTLSCYAKADEKSIIQISPTGSSGLTTYANFDLVNGVVGDVGTGATATIKESSNGFYFCSMTFTATANGTGTDAFFIQDATTATRGSTSTGNGVDGLYLFGVQKEQATFPTSYIPTAGSTVTRSPDSIAIDSPISADFTIFTEVAPLADGSDYADTGIRLFSTTDSGTDTLRTAGSSWVFVPAGGGGAIGIVKTELSADTYTKLSFSGEQDGANANMLAYKDGSVKINEVDIVTLDHSDQQFMINNYSTNYGAFHYKSVKLWDYALTDKQQEKLTK